MFRDDSLERIVMTYKEQLERIIAELKQRQSDLSEEYELLPEGHLVFSMQNGLKRYIQRIPATGNRKRERRYGVKRKPEILSGLVRKEYIQDALPALEKDIRLIEKAARYYVPSDENSIMAQFVEAQPELAYGIYKPSVDENEWKMRFDRIENYHDENLTQVASDGKRMRSKNEVYIASRLDHYGITYRSDCPTGIPDLSCVPDFTILRKRDGKIIYWEHLGMMDDLEYRKDNKRKLEQYEEFNIVPWDNLILTYDTPGGGLRADYIEAMIKTWLL